MQSFPRDLGRLPIGPPWPDPDCAQGPEPGQLDATALVALLARFAASGGDKAARRVVFARHGVAERVKRRCSGRVDFQADIRAGNRVDLVAEDPPGGQPLNIMPIERDEAGVGELRRGGGRQEWTWIKSS